MSPTRTRSIAHDGLDEPTIDGAFSDDGVDLTLIRWMLRLTPTQRLQSAQALINAVSALRGETDDRARRAHDP